MSSALRSMTGFGAADLEEAGVRVRVEVRSVNGRGVKCSTRLSPLLEPAGNLLEARVREYVHRGSVNLTVTLRRVDRPTGGTVVGGVLEDYLNQVRAAEERLGLPAETRMADLLRLPGAVEQASPDALTDEETALALRTADAALDALVAMREREGTALSTTLSAGADDVERLADAIEARVPAALAAHQERLRERLDALLTDADAPQELVAREIALLAERTDVAEELDRLRSHVAQWREALTADGPHGRRLDFLAQELGREANTVGAKAQDVELGKHVVELKLVVDRLKEQAANVE